MLRYDVTVGSPEVKRLLSYGGSNTPPVAETPVTAGVWTVVVADDDKTRKVSVAVNQVDTFAKIVKSANHLVEPTGYFEIGYHTSGNSLRLAKVGDTYLFSESLRTSPDGLAKLGQLVAALKAEYGIA